MADEKSKTPPKKKKAKQDIFNNSRVETLATQYKKNHDFASYQKICQETSDLMDAVIRGNRFDRQVPFSDLKNNLFLQLENWILKWNPEDGKIYSYFSACIRHGCLTVVSKEALFHQRFAVTDVPLDALMDGERIASSSEIPAAVIETLQRAASNIYCRWTEPVVQEVLRYMVSCVLRGRGDRRPQILKTVQMGWGLPMDTSRFLLDWAHGSVRAALLEHYHQPMGEIDIIRAAQKFSIIPDIINVIGLDNTLRLINTFAGTSVRFPSLQQVRKWQESVAIYTSMCEDPSPANVKALGKKYRKSAAKINEAFERIVDNLKSGVLEDVELYPTKESLPKFK